MFFRLTNILFTLTLAIPLEAFCSSVEEGHDCYKNEDYKCAYTIFEPLAIKGDKRAQYFLAGLYLGKPGINLNYKEAYRWYKKSADQGFPNAIAQLANMYLHGKGVKKNVTKAIELFEDSVQKGFPGPYLLLGEIYSKTGNESKAIESFEKAAQHGILQAHIQLARYYELKHKLSERDHQLSLAAEKGNTEAQFRLGEIYGSESRVLDYKKSVFWLEKAALKGHAKAQYYLGLKYSSGKGVEKDLTQSFQLIKDSATQGLRNAQFLTGYKYANGEGVPVNHANAVYWFAIASRNGHKKANTELKNSLNHLPKIKIRLPAVNMRDKPSMDGSPLITVNMNQIFPVLGKKDNWFLVYIEKNNLIGYIQDFVVTNI